VDAAGIILVAAVARRCAGARDAVIVLHGRRRGRGLPALSSGWSRRVPDEIVCSILVARHAEHHAANPPSRPRWQAAWSPRFVPVDAAWPTAYNLMGLESQLRRLPASSRAAPLPVGPVGGGRGDLTAQGQP
jgi:hypothetical protein